MLWRISYLIGMLRILANEVDDLEDGEERYAPAAREVRKEAAA